MTTYLVNRNDYTDGSGARVEGGHLGDEHTFYYLDSGDGLHFGIPGSGDIVLGDSSGWSVGTEHSFSGSIGGVGTWYGGRFENGASLNAATVVGTVAGPGGTVTGDEFTKGVTVEGGTVTAKTVQGTATTSGGDSKVTVTDLTGDAESGSPGLEIGGGNVTVTNMQAAADIGVSARASAGTTTVTNFAIGSKFASISVSGTAKFTVTNMTFGHSSGDHTIASVSGPNAAFKYSTATPIGDAGVGELSLDDGATMSIGNAVLGKASGGQGYLTASGKAHLDIGSLTLGLAGYGSFHLESGATAKVSGNFTVGQAATGYGLFGVAGSGSRLAVAGKVTLNSGVGSSQVVDGSRLDVGSLVIGGTAGLRPGLTVSGQDSALNAKGAVVIGQLGEGTLAVADDAQFTANGHTIVLGKKAGSRGTLTLTDATKNIGATDVTVGDAGIGTLGITRGAEQVFKSITVGAKAGSSGILTLGTPSATAGDTASKLHVSGDLLVGVAGNGLAAIYGVATIDGGATLGDLDGGTGDMTVQGKGAAVAVTDTVSLGGQIIGGKVGAGHLSVYNGGHVTTGADAGVIGYTKGSSVTVLGQGSELHTDVLAMFRGTLDVKDKGVLKVKELAVGSLTADNSNAATKLLKLFWDPIFALIGESLEIDGTNVIGGKVAISGSGTKVEAETIRLAVASLSSGYGFSVTSGAAVSVKPSNPDEVAFALDGGSARIHGSNSSLAVHGQATLGLADAGSGYMFVGSNAKVTIDEKLTLTSSPGLADFSDLSVGLGGSVEVGGSGKAAANTILVDVGHKIIGNGVLHASKIVVSGQIESKGRDELVLIGDVQGSGKLIVDPGATLTLGDSDHEVEVAFRGDGGTLTLRDPTGFTAALLQLSRDDKIVLVDVDIQRASLDVKSSELNLYTEHGRDPAFTFSVQGDFVNNDIVVDGNGISSTLIMVSRDAKRSAVADTVITPADGVDSAAGKHVSNGGHDDAGPTGRIAANPMTGRGGTDHFVFLPADGFTETPPAGDVIPDSWDGADKTDFHRIDADTWPAEHQAFAPGDELNAVSAMAAGHNGSE